MGTLSTLGFAAGAFDLGTPLNGVVAFQTPTHFIRLLYGILLTALVLRAVVRVASWERRPKIVFVTGPARYTLPLLATALLSACSVSNVRNPNGLAAVEIDPALKGPVSGVGIESHDIVAMTDQMMRDILSVPELAGRRTPPRVIVDSAYFSNDSSQALNKNTITDRLRVALSRSSAGRMVFVGRHYARMVEEERSLKRAGVVDTGTTGLTRAPAGGDFRLGGRISSLDSRQASTGVVQRYNQIIFEMVDLESDVLVWTGIYEFARAAADDVVYR